LDGELRQLAISVSPFMYSEDNYEVNNAAHLQEESDFLIQVWKADHLIYSSHPKILIPLLDEGYGNVLWQGEDLRYYHRVYKDRVIQVAQSTEERRDFEYDIFRNIMLTIVLMFPVIVMLVRVVIGHGLRPLRILSRKVEERDAQNLAPIDINDAPKEVLPVIQSLNQLLKRLENSLILQRQFTADAAHELRTPLSAIKLNLDMLCRAENENERKAIESSLEDGVDRAINLAQSLLLLARHETDALSVDMEQVDMVAITGQVIENLKVLAGDKGQQVSYKKPEGKKVYINAQHHNISVMVENLFQNSILYTPANGHIEVEVAVSKTNVVLLIADDGPGIKPEERSRVFDRFYRCQGTKQQGSGLGLSIIKNIVEYYQGTIVIEDGLGGKGSSFVVTFPVSTVIP